MKILSRHLPALPKENRPWWTWLLVTGFLTWLGYTAYKLPYLFAILVLIGLFVRFRHQKKMKKLFASRPDDSICTFADDLNPRIADPWIIRATYEEFGSHLKLDDRMFPIRASDRLEEDLDMDSEDLVDSLIVVAKRTDRSITDTMSNPYYDRVKTVHDFVMFLNHQPKNAEPGAAPNSPHAGLRPS
jgi:acyl carrier protein